MAKEKEIKTNAMRILDRQKVKYEVFQYECDEFIDGLHTAEVTGAPVEQSFKTLVAQGKSKQYYVLVLPQKIGPRILGLGFFPSTRKPVS